LLEKSGVICPELFGKFSFQVGENRNLQLPEKVSKKLLKLFSVWYNDAPCRFLDGKELILQKDW